MITNESLTKLINEKSKNGNRYKVMNLVDRYHKYAQDPEFDERTIFETRMYGDVHQFYQELLEL